MKVAEIEDIELTYSHKYITNTFTCETVLIEYLLNGDRISYNYSFKNDHHVLE